MLNESTSFEEGWKVMEQETIVGDRAKLGKILEEGFQRKCVREVVALWCSRESAAAGLVKSNGGPIGRIGGGDCATATRMTDHSTGAPGAPTGAENRFAILDLF